MLVMIASAGSAIINLIWVLLILLIRVGSASWVLICGWVWAAGLTTVAALCVTTRGLSDFASCGDPV